MKTLEKKSQTTLFRPRDLAPPARLVRLLLGSRPLTLSVQ